MKIEYKEGLIVLKDQDEEVGYIKYVRKEENVIDVISTVVHEKYQGQGMAGKLFDALMGYVKDNSLKIIPSCSYIEKKLDETTKFVVTFCINRAKKDIIRKKLIFMRKNNNIFLQLGKIIYIILL